MSRFCPLILASLLSSCALVSTPVKVVGKATTTTIGLAGKAAGAGIDALSSDSKEEKE